MLQPCEASPESATSQTKQNNANMLLDCATKIEKQTNKNFPFPSHEPDSGVIRNSIQRLPRVECQCQPARGYLSSGIRWKRTLSLELWGLYNAPDNRLEGHVVEVIHIVISGSHLH